MAPLPERAPEPKGLVRLPSAADLAAERFGDARRLPANTRPIIEQARLYLEELGLASDDADGVILAIAKASAQHKIVALLGQLETDLNERAIAAADGVDGGYERALFQVTMNESYKAVNRELDRLDEKVEKLDRRLRKLAEIRAGREDRRRYSGAPEGQSSRFGGQRTAGETEEPPASSD